VLAQAESAFKIQSQAQQYTTPEVVEAAAGKLLIFLVVQVVMVVVVQVVMVVVRDQVGLLVLQIPAEVVAAGDMHRGQVLLAVQVLSS